MPWIFKLNIIWSHVSRFALRRWSWRHNILWRTKNHWWTMALETKKYVFITKMWISSKPKWSSNWIFLPLQALQLYHLKGRRECKVIKSLCHFAKILQLICCSQMQFIVVWTMSLNFFPWGNLIPWLLNKCSNEVITCFIIDITNFFVKLHQPCIIHNTKS